MCGRYTLTSSGEELARHFEAEPELDLAPRFNVAPTQRVVVVRTADREDADATPGERHFDRHRWGLIPAWARDETIGHRTFNARSETVSTKPAFRAAIRARRCLVPLNGFYEWRRRGRRREPSWFHPVAPDGALWAAAGLWERWRHPADGVVASCTILTTGANEVVAATHDRMPVLLRPADYARWLDPELCEPDALADLFVPWPADRTAVRAVSDRVNDVRAEGSELLRPAEPPDQPELFE